MSMSSTIDAYRLFVLMQGSFSRQTCDMIFGARRDHFWEKWITSGNNIIYFLTLIDTNEANEVLTWGERLLTMA